jgi:hypothetical protein
LIEHAMSDAYNPNSILIRIEIHVPCGSGAPQIVAQTTPAHTPVAATQGDSQLRQRGIYGSISYPKGKVKSNGGTTGVVCAIGKADPDALGYFPNEIKLLLMDPDLGEPTYPVGVGPGYLNKDTGDWCELSLGEAKCGPAAAPVKNKLVVYYIYPSGLWTKDVFFFDGECSNQTDCEAEGVTCPAAAARAAGPPPAWKTTVQGFAGDGLELFNEAWRLERRSSCAQPPVWDNGLDGQKQPRVELSRPSNGPWRLRFQLGQRAIDYTKPPETWSYDGMNILTAVTTTGVSPRASLPASIMLTPIVK